MLRCEATKIWRSEILGKMFVNIDADKGIRGIVGHKEIGINMIE
jgi:hypothetical protein